MSKPIYRMSGAGRCPRALSAERLGYVPEPAPPWLEMAANEGKWHEDRIAQALGIDPDSRQDEVTLDYPTFQLVGHIDGMFYDSEYGLSHLVEIKSMSQYEFDRWMKEGFKGFPSYAAQLTCYMEATGLSEALYIVKNRSSGYEDRRVVGEQPFSLSDIVTKLQMVTQATELCPVDFDPNSLECKRCGFKALCAPEPKELTPFDQNKLEVAAESWRAGKRLVNDGQAMIDTAKEILEQHTYATGIEKWRFAELAISLVHVNGRTDYPKKKLLEIFTKEQLEPASEVKEPYEYIKVSDLRKEEEDGTK